jgi:hypothetical protein
LLVRTGVASAQSPQVFSATGADIPAAIDAFRAALGGADNGVTPGPLLTGRREITWDDVPDTLATPNAIPYDYYVNTSPRGFYFSEASPQFHRVSARTGNPSATPVRFADVDPAYAGYFTPYSGERMLAQFNGNLIGVSLKTPGLGLLTPAGLTQGFGVVFTDVNLPNTTYFELSLADGTTVNYYVPATTGHGGQSFLAVRFPTAAIGYVLIHLGTTAMAPGITEDATHDLVVMDDVIYGEPQATSFSISDATVVEGNAGTREAVFTVTRSTAYLGPRQLNYTVHDGTAHRGEDFNSAGGAIWFRQGEVSVPVSIPIIGDTNVEPDETFTVGLESCCLELYARQTGTGTILNDDGPMTMHVNVTSPWTSERFRTSKSAVTLGGLLDNPTGASTVTWQNDRQSQRRAGTDHDRVPQGRWHGRHPHHRDDSGHVAEDVSRGHHSRDGRHRLLHRRHVDRGLAAGGRADDVLGQQPLRRLWRHRGLIAEHRLALCRRCREQLLPDLRHAGESQ